jgi:UDP-2,4-diacetamido-2,4,6-trideoxy-beta-L-altropyranose hydrolase
MASVPQDRHNPEVIRFSMALITKSVVIRTLRFEDMLDVYLWRTDSLSMSASESQEKFSLESHKQWFTKLLHDASSKSFIGMVDEEKFGLVRFQQSGIEGTAYVSINTNPLMRGRGLSKILLAMAINKYHLTNDGILLAKIRDHNILSKKIFRGVGFYESKKIEGFVVMQLDAMRDEPQKLPT